MPVAALINLTSTACVATLFNPKFEDVNYVPTQDTIAMDMALRFNGIADELVDRVTFARNATQTVKNAAVRARVNEILQSYEPGVTLNNANIQIVGLPV